MTEERLLPAGIADDRSRAILAISERLEDLDRSLLLIYRIDSVMAAALYPLAWQFGMTGLAGWDLSDTEEKQRELIRRAIEFHRHRGTPWVIKEALRTVGWPSPIVDEHYGAARYDGTFRYDATIQYSFAAAWAKFSVIIGELADDEALSAPTTELLMAIIELWKNARSHLVEIAFSTPDLIESMSRVIDAPMDVDLVTYHRYDGEYSFDATIDYSGFDTVVLDEARDDLRLAMEISGAASLMFRGSEAVTLPSSIASFGRQTFRGSDTATLPSSVASLGRQKFRGIADVGLVESLGAAGTSATVAETILAVLTSANFPFLGLDSSMVNLSGAGTWNDVRGGAYPSLVSVGTSRPGYSLDPSGKGVLTFDGVAHYLAAAFGLNNPFTLFFILKQIGWTTVANLCDGVAVAGSAVLYQTPAAPSIRQFGGVDGAISGDLPLGAFAVVEAQFNGAASKIRVNENAPVAADAGTRNPGGLTLASQSAHSSHFANIAMQAACVASIIPTGPQSSKIRSTLGRYYGIAGY
jgi:P2-related tail formation protein